MMKGTPIFEPLLAGPEDNWDIPLVSQGQVSGGIKIFETESDMNAWSTKYTSRRDKTVAIVLSDDADRVVHTFRWNGTKFVDFELGTQQIPLSGISFVNPDGSTTSGIELLALKGLALEGNEKDGFTLAAKSSGFSVGPYLEYQDDGRGGKVIDIKPGTFELRKTPGFLAYVKYSELVYGKAKEGNFYRKGTIWPDMTVVSSEGMLQIDRDNKAIGLQDTDSIDDPNVSGGSHFLVWPMIYLEGNAPSDGYVELVWYKKSDGTIAVDDNGHPMAIRHNYKAGEELTPDHAPLMFAQVLNAKGITEYSLALVDNFDEYVKVQNFSVRPSGICIQELSDKGMSSSALVQAETNSGFSVRAESYYVGTYLASINYLTSIVEQARKVPAGSRANTVAGVEMYAVTDIQYEVSQGSIKVSPFEGNIADFYIGLEINPEVSRIVAGKTLDVALSLVDKDDAWNIGFFTYSGDLANRPPVYSKRNNGPIVLNPGWSQFSSSFISEDAVSGLHSFASTSSPVPADADFIMVAIYPVIAQDPCDITLKSFHVDASPALQGFEVNSIDIEGLQHLDFMTQTTRMIQTLSGNQAILRYTDGPGSIPMPLGVPEKPLKYLTLDDSLNVVAGSQAGHGEGALVASEHVELDIWQKWQLYNEQPDSHEAQYWLEVYRDSTGQATEIPASRTTFIVESKRPGVDYFTTNKVTVTLEPGDYIYSRCSTDVKDGAYAQTNIKSKPLCITYIQERYLG